MKSAAAPNENPGRTVRAPCRPYTVTAFCGVGLVALVSAIILANAPLRKEKPPPGEPGHAGSHRQASVTVPIPPRRIVSLAPSITETLFALDLGTRTVGVTKFCDYPPEALKKTKVGGYCDPNIEAIVSLKPDLVILLRGHELARKNLEQLGIEILSVDNSEVEEILQAIRKIGEACSRTAQANTLTENLTERMSAIRRKTSSAEKPGVLLCVDRALDVPELSDVYVAGREGFYSRLIELAGAKNVCRNALIQFPRISAEGIIELDPDIIVDCVPDTARRELNPDQLLGAWKTVDCTTAVSRGQVHLFTEGFSTIPGPRFILLLEKMARTFHPAITWNNK